MRIKISFYLLFMGFTLLGVAQNADTQVLLQNLSSSVGKERAEILIKLTNQIKFTDQEQAKTYAEEALAISEETGYIDGIIGSTYYLSIYERDVNKNFSKAVRLAEKGLKTAEEDQQARSQLLGLEILKTIYQLSGRNRKLAATEAAYNKLKTEVDLNYKAGQLDELSSAYSAQQETLSRVSQENEEIQDLLEQTTEEKLRKEKELAEIAKEKAELENETLQLRIQAAEQSLQLQKERNLRNLVITLLGILLLIGFIGWQRFRLQKQKQLAEIEKQKRIQLSIVNEATSRFVPNAFLHSLGKTDITEVKLGDHVQRRVTVLFADIRGYTTLSEKMTPSENFDFVNDFNSHLGPIINENDGFINQYLGDGIMAIFMNSPQDALESSIRIQEKLAIYNQLRSKKQLSTIRVGIGFHTGNLIMGIIGDRNRLDAATISDTVNTASRIENLTKYYGANILFSGDSHQWINEEYTPYFRYLGQVQMKGKKIPVSIYECFHGDLEESRVKKHQTNHLFKAAINAYYEKEFEIATQTLAGIVEDNPLDIAAKLFYERAQLFLENGVPDSWDGINRMMIK